MSGDFRLGPWLVRPGLNTISKNGADVQVEPKVMEVLVCLASHPGDSISKETIIKAVWPNTFVSDDALIRCVSELRRVFEDDARAPAVIQTIPKRGYRLLAPVRYEPATDMPHEGPGQTIPIELARRFSFRGRTLILFGAIPLILLAVVVVSRLMQFRPPRVVGFTQITHDGLSKGRAVTDGERLYFPELRGDRFVIGQVSVAGGETSILPIPFTNVLIGDISTDGSTLVVISFQGTGQGMEVWSLSLPGSAPRRWGDLVARAVALAPDGRQMIFSQWADIYTAKSERDEPKKLATAGNPVTGIRFSPDGRKVRFEVVDPGNGSSSIWEMARDGTGLRPLFPGSSRDPRQCCGNWTPDGKYFLFQGFRNGRNSLWALAEKSSWYQGAPKPVQLTNGPLDFSLPVVSKDGKRIFAVGSQPRSEVVRYDGKTGFVPYLDGSSVTELAFSADGNWVAFVSIPERQLWRSRVDGSERLQLTPDGLSAALPRWSPDGKKIAFMGTNFRTDWLAYVISSDGTGLHEFVPGAQAGYDPGWSPDGRSAVLTLNRAGTLGVPPDAPGIATYEFETRKLALLPGAKRLFAPRWSPDGRYIAANTNDSLKLMLFDRVDQHWEELVSLPLGYSTWSHDSQYIYFDTILTADPAFFRVRISDHKLERLFSLKNVRRYWGTFGAWVGLTPDDSPLIVRDTSSQEIYALDLQVP